MDRPLADDEQVEPSSVRPAQGPPPTASMPDPMPDDLAEEPPGWEPDEDVDNMDGEAPSG